ncbi:hypothetical protein Cni_G06808 [Canna indica]|uniref:Uncharacterized protein n=1 Tax=Canna indica TaxID=4628 RepID=A0AAQ3JZ96_9LILI|nr:hypothetical protein Cni_G06808 [Canna indica]
MSSRNEVVAAYVATLSAMICEKDVDARILKNKHFPYYEKLSVVFGKDRATGVNVEMPLDAVERLDEEEVEVRDDVEVMDSPSSINVTASSSMTRQG